MPPLKRSRRSSRPPAKRRRLTQRAPQLPIDVWHSIAAHLPPASLAALAATCSDLRAVAQPALHSVVWRAVFPNPPPNALQSRALTNIINLLHTAPSLRPKSVACQISLLCQGTPHLPDPFSCFTVDQAVAFLNVDRNLLVSRYSPARVRPTRRASKRPCAPAYQPFPPDVPARSECPARVFTLTDVLRAAYATHLDMRNCLVFVHFAVTKDFLRFERAQRAEMAVLQIAAESRIEIREVEYALSASTPVTEFRRGLWTLTFDEYCRLVRQMIDVHVGLGGCYKCLLICDGNARLKAKRIVGKILRSSDVFNVCDVVKALEGNLWWAKSKSNVQKMEEMSRTIPKIRV